MANETTMLWLAWAAGIVLGAIFFGGLWWTVRRGLVSDQPVLWFGSSLAVRMTIAVGGFYLVGRDHWHWLICCMLGFFMARLLVTRITRPVPPVEVVRAH